MSFRRTGGAMFRIIDIDKSHFWINGNPFLHYSSRKMAPTLICDCLKLKATTQLCVLLADRDVHLPGHRGWHGTPRLMIIQKRFWIGETSTFRNPEDWWQELAYSKKDYIIRGVQGRIILWLNCWKDARSIFGWISKWMDGCRTDHS
jgi:hypothetical protein